MFNPDLNQKPINVMPKSVIFLLFLVAFVEFVLQLGQKGLIGEQALLGWRMELIQKYGFFDAIFEWMRNNNTYKFDDLIRFFTYSFIHRRFIEIIFILVFIATFGKFVAEVYGDIEVILIFILSGAIGALGFGIFANHWCFHLGAVFYSKNERGNRISSISFNYIFYDYNINL
jgi:rhomboid protease GluP